MHPIQCKCGTVRGQLDGAGINNRVVCYCADCRAYAYYLGRPEEVLDAHGGTEIVQVAQARLRLSHGKEHLAAVRLSENGMVRWYAACCNTPVGNTMLNTEISFIGLVHSSLERSQMDIDFGNSIARVNTGSATGKPKPTTTRLVGSVLKFLWIVLSTRFVGRHGTSELFNESGSPIVRPKVLAAEELERLNRGEV